MTWEFHRVHILKASQRLYIKKAAVFLKQFQMCVVRKKKAVWKWDVNKWGCQQWGRVAFSTNTWAGWLVESGVFGWMMVRKCWAVVWISFPGLFPCESEAQCLPSETWLCFRPDGLVRHLREPHRPRACSSLPLLSSLISSTSSFPPPSYLSFKINHLLLFSPFSFHLWLPPTSRPASFFFLFLSPHLSPMSLALLLCSALLFFFPPPSPIFLPLFFFNV